MTGSLRERSRSIRPSCNLWLNSRACVRAGDCSTTAGASLFDPPSPRGQVSSHSGAMYVTRLCTGRVGRTPYIAFKRRNAAPFEITAWGWMFHQFAYNRDRFMAHYHKRSNVESAFSMIKGKFGDSVMSKSPVGMSNEVLAKVLCHNVVVVGQAVHEFGIPGSFTTVSADAETG
jgi:hypothetical protein